VRPSTTAVDDGRQSFAILNTFSFILEGRNGRSFHDDLQRRTEGQLAAIEAFLRFVNDHDGEIRRIVSSGRKLLERSREPVVVQMDYLFAGATIPLPMTLLSSGADTTVAMKFAPRVTPLRTVRRPVAYLIPREQTELIAALDRLGIRTERIVHAAKKKAEIAAIADVIPVWMENKSSLDIVTRVRTGTVDARPGDILVPLAQTASTLAVIALEPESMWGFAQYDEFAGLRKKDTDYPVYRIMN